MSATSISEWLELSVLESESDSEILQAAFCQQVIRDFASESEESSVPPSVRVFSFVQQSDGASDAQSAEDEKTPEHTSADSDTVAVSAEATVTIRSVKQPAEVESADDCDDSSVKVNTTSAVSDTSESNACAKSDGILRGQRIDAFVASFSVQLQTDDKRQCDHSLDSTAARRLRIEMTETQTREMLERVQRSLESAKAQLEINVKRNDTDNAVLIDAKSDAIGEVHSDDSTEVSGRCIKHSHSERRHKRLRDTDKDNDDCKSESVDLSFERSTHNSRTKAEPMSGDNFADLLGILPLDASTDCKSESADEYYGGEETHFGVGNVSDTANLDATASNHSSVHPSISKLKSVVSKSTGTPQRRQRKRKSAAVKIQRSWRLFKVKCALVDTFNAVMQSIAESSRNVLEIMALSTQHVFDSTATDSRYQFEQSPCGDWFQLYALMEAIVFRNLLLATGGSHRLVAEIMRLQNEVEIRRNEFEGSGTREALAKLKKADLRLVTLKQELADVCDPQSERCLFQNGFLMQPLVLFPKDAAKWTRIKKALKLSPVSNSKAIQCDSDTTTEIPLAFVTPKKRGECYGCGAVSSASLSGRESPRSAMRDRLKLLKRKKQSKKRLMKSTTQTPMRFTAATKCVRSKMETRKVKLRKRP